MHGNNKYLGKLKKNWLNILLIVFALTLLFVPNVKSWFLQKMVSTGLFNAAIKEQKVDDRMQAANFSFINQKGDTVQTSQLRGKTLFINFWASWCPPCRAEMPSINELFKKLQADSSIVFIFINEDEDKTKAVEYLAKNNFTIPINNEAGEMPREIFSGSLPTTVVIDKTGKMVLNHTGMANYNSDKFIRQLQGLSK